MFPCPKCQTQLPEEARFCNKCGFHQTNTRRQAIVLPSPQQSDLLGEDAPAQAKQSLSTQPCPLPVGELPESPGNFICPHIYSSETTFPSKEGPKKTVLAASTSFLDRRSTFLPYLPSKLPGTSSRNLRAFSTSIANGEDSQNLLMGEGQQKAQRGQTSSTGLYDQVPLPQETNISTSLAQLMSDTSQTHSSHTAHLQGVVVAGRHKKNPLLTVWGLAITIIFTLAFVIVVGVITYFTLLKL